jgi:hypothetical protein
MNKKMAGKKVHLNRETLRQLSTDRLEAVAGGATGRSLCYTCGSVCHTNCHTC